MSGSSFMSQRGKVQTNITMGSQCFFMLLLITTTSVVLLLLIIKQERKRLSVQASRSFPPGPKKLPVIGNLHQLGNSPHVSLQSLSNDYGPFMFLQLGSIPTLIISSTDVAREIFKNHDIIFSGRPGQLYAAKKLSYNLHDITFAPYGEYWREVRKIAVLELLSLKRVQSFQAVRNEEVALMLQFVTTQIQSSEPIDLSKLTLLLANNFICRVTLGKKFVSGDDGTSRFDNLLHEVQTLLGKPNISDFFPWMAWINRFNGVKASVEKCFRELDKFYDEIILEHLDPERPMPEHEDLVDVLLRLQKDASFLTNEKLKGVLTDMFIAGTDTSSATLVWTMTELIRNPFVMRRAQNEVREACKGKEKVEEGDLSKLVYLRSVIKESWRLHPPAPLLVPRETTEDCIVLEGYNIPSKTRVIINAKAIGTDPKYWENPYEFRPERFLNSCINFKGQNFEFIPFGVGRRGCPGINFAVSMIELALANLLYCFDWKLPQGMRSEDLDMEEAFGITMHKKIPLCLQATHAII